jgi:hypothetical protein
MPLGVALSDLRYELRAEIYSSLLPAHGLSSVDMQNVILERTQRELWNQYEWPHLNYHVDIAVPANTQFLDYDATMPFENVLGLWFNYQPDAMQPWKRMRYGFEDWINETMHSYQPVRWRVASVDPATGLAIFRAKDRSGLLSVDVPHALEGPGRNPLQVDTDACIIDSTGVLIGGRAAQGRRRAKQRRWKAQSTGLYTASDWPAGANKRDVYALAKAETCSRPILSAPRRTRLHSAPERWPIRSATSASSTCRVASPRAALRTLRNYFGARRRGGEKRTAFVAWARAGRQSRVLSRNGEIRRSEWTFRAHRLGRTPHRLPSDWRYFAAISRRDHR